MDTILTGSARTTVAALMAKVAALEAQIAQQQPTKAKGEMPAFRTKAQRKAGKGWACSAAEPCSRRDLRTEKRSRSHGADGHFAR